MYVCFNGGGGGGAYAFGKIFQPFGHSILLEKIGLLLASVKPKCWTKSFFRESRFSLFSSTCFFTYVEAVFWQSSVSVGFSRFWLCIFP